MPRRIDCGCSGELGQTDFYSLRLAWILLLLAHDGHGRRRVVEEPLPGPTVGEARVAAHDDDMHASSDQEMLERAKGSSC